MDKVFNISRILALSLILCESFFGFSCSADQIIENQKEVQLKLLNDHQTALYVSDQPMKDPFITLAPDGYYYLTYASENICKPGICVMKSKNLVDWENLGLIWEPLNGTFAEELRASAIKRNVNPIILSPKIFFVDNKWILTYSSNVQMANLMLTNGNELKGPFNEPFGLKFGFHRNPFLFLNSDGIPWLFTNCTQIQKMTTNYSNFDGNHSLVNPKNRLLGFEGVSIIKFNNKYVLFGACWSTDIMKKGTCNLYYCTADNVTGPYGIRKFVGRFLGNGTPFKDKNGNWWCTAFKNANTPTLDPAEAKNMDLRGAAYTINKEGLTLVPLEIRMVNEDVEIFAKDENYRYPGNEEVQRY